MFEYAARVERDVFHAGSVSRIGIASAAVVGADGLVHVAVEAIQQIAQNESGVGCKHFAINSIHVEIARRPQPRRQLAVVPLVLQ